MAQSGAIALVLARDFGLLGSTFEEEYLNTSLLYSLEDFIPKFSPAVFALTEEGKANMENKKKEFLEIHGPFFLKIWEARFTKHAGKYAVGDTFSLSDIIFGVMLTMGFRHPCRKDTWESVLLANAPKLAAHIDNINSNELKEYWAKGFIGQAPI